MSDLIVSITVEDAEVLNTPAYLDVRVGDGEADEIVSFDLYGDAGVWIGLATATLDAYGGVLTSIPLPAVPTGLYVMQVIGSVSTTGYAEFTVLEPPLDDDVDDEASVPDLPEATDDHHWRFVDTTVGSTYEYTMTRNPQKWTNPSKPLFLEHDVTTAPDGNILAWQGADRSWTFEFSGYIDTQAEYEALEFWAGLRRRFWLIDHRNRARYVTFEQFDARPRIVPNKPWAHDYTMRVVHFYRQDLSGED